MMEGSRAGYAIQMVLAIISQAVAMVVNCVMLPFSVLGTFVRASAPKAKVVLITGATSGIGEALALQYAAAGITLILVGRNGDRLRGVEDLCKTKGAVVIPKQIDVCDEKQMADMIRSVHTQMPIDLVIANAGVSEGTIGAQKDIRKGAEVVTKINVLGVHNTVLPAIESFRETKKGGQIAIVSSMVRLIGSITGS